ncbi:uncharacterized protein LOC110749406 [Prunus avium]|uniref:Uncharacterized protein LOC110749406 n=1 Tax=Prunus avium TaxID=42229 RepID=A0A6P5RVS9_PRUAV|nr:uncharacterized protein LOC110749406 [Prunus avium]
MQYLQKTVAAAAAPRSRSRSVWVLGNQAQSLRPGLAPAMASRPADTALHAGDYEADPVVTTGDPQATENVAEEKPAVDEQQRQVDKSPSSWGKGKGTGTEPVSPPNKPSYPNASFPRLEKTEVTLQPDPSDHPINYTQKRRASQYATAATGLSLENFDLEKVSCVGLDGTPWPRDKENEEHKTDRDREDEREYYKHHKASPLSEIEFADTRKPITRVMYGTADAVSEYGAGRDVIRWRPEQLDTAEEALSRAARIWKENAMRGDPDAPHSRVLRALRGESF